jgi:hypothetical protein
MKKCSMVLIGTCAYKITVVVLIGTVAYKIIVWYL